MIYHITTEQHWSKAMQSGSYIHPSLTHEGFIHCSTREQLAGTIARYFSSVQELLILHLDLESFGRNLKWELSRDNELFPHIYSAIPLEAVKHVERFNH